MRTERTKKVSQATSRYAIAGISRLVADTTTTFVTQESHNGISRAHIGREAIIQGIVNKAVDDKVRSVEFKNLLIRIIEDVPSSPHHVMKMTGAMLENQNFVASLATIVKKETEKAGDIE